MDSLQEIPTPLPRLSSWPAFSHQPLPPFFTLTCGPSPQDRPPIFGLSRQDGSGLPTLPGRRGDFLLCRLVTFFFLSFIATKWRVEPRPPPFLVFPPSPSSAKGGGGKARLFHLPLSERCLFLPLPSLPRFRWERVEERRWSLFFFFFLGGGPF